MARTLWVNTYTGDWMEQNELADLRTKAHAVYAANGHLFEDEADALVALGAVPLASLVS
jgi:hypothetical protein